MHIISSQASDFAAGGHSKRKKAKSASRPRLGRCEANFLAARGESSRGA